MPFQAGKHWVFWNPDPKLSVQGMPINLGWIVIPFMEDLWKSDKKNRLSSTSTRISSTKSDHLETILLPGPNLTLPKNKSFQTWWILCYLVYRNQIVLKNQPSPECCFTLSHARLEEETSTKSAKVSRILEEASREVFGSVTSRSDSQSLKASVPINVTELGICRRSSRVPEVKGKVGIALSSDRNRTQQGSQWIVPLSYHQTNMVERKKHVFSCLFIFELWDFIFQTSNPLDKKGTWDIIAKTSFLQGIEESKNESFGPILLSFNLETPIHQYSSQSLEFGHFALKYNLENIKEKKTISRHLGHPRLECMKLFTRKTGRILRNQWKVLTINYPLGWCHHIYHVIIWWKLYNDATTCSSQNGWEKFLAACWVLARPVKEKFMLNYAWVALFMRVYQIGRYWYSQ